MTLDDTVKRLLMQDMDFAVASQNQALMSAAVKALMDDPDTSEETKKKVRENPGAYVYVLESQFEDLYRDQTVGNLYELANARGYPIGPSKADRNVKINDMYNRNTIINLERELARRKGLVYTEP